MFATILILALPQILLLTLYCLEHDNNPESDASDKRPK